MRTRIDIRPATPADAPALLALRRQVLHEPTFLLSEPDAFDRTAEDEANRIQRLSDWPHSLVLVAADGPHLVGTLTVVGEDLRRRRHAAMLAVSIARSHWGQGIATAMLAHVQAWPRGAGPRRLELMAHTSNQRAVRVDLKAGFQVEVVRRRPLVVDGADVDEYAMAWLGDA